MSQISQGGEPVSFSYRLSKDIPNLHIKTPNITEEYIREHTISSLEPVSKVIPVNVDILSVGKCTNTPEGKVCQYEINIPKAVSLNLIFEDLYLPEGCQLYIYNPEKTQILGAYNHINNSNYKFFPVELLIGDRAIIELLVSSYTREEPVLKLAKVNFYFGKLPNILIGSYSRDEGDSGSCNVNVACPEAEGWQTQKMV